MGLYYSFCESLYLLFLWKLILVGTLHKGNLLCESYYLLWHKGQPALWVTNGCTSVLNPTSILSTPMSVDNELWTHLEVSLPFPQGHKNTLVLDYLTTSMDNETLFN